MVTPSLYGQGAFRYRKPITINHSQVGLDDIGTLLDFPVLIDITSDDLKDKTNGGKVESSNGWDIVFRASDGMTQLDHEVEEYEPTTGKLVAWVRIPILSKSSDTVFFMYYGNPGITSSTENVAGVWNPRLQGCLALGRVGDG